MDFHHLDPAEKDFTISDRMTSFEAIKKELAKTVLLCCRCHREVHDGWHPRYVAGEDRGPEEDDESADFDFPTPLEEPSSDDMLALHPPTRVIYTSTGGGAIPTVDPNHVPVASRALDEVDVGAPVTRLDVADEGDGPSDASGQLRVTGRPGTGDPLDGREIGAEIGLAHGDTRMYTGEDQSPEDFLGSLG